MPPDAVGVLDTNVDVSYGQWYLFDPDAVDAIPALVDSVGQVELFEARCASRGGGAMVLSLREDGPARVVVRSLPSAPPLDDGADHVAECSLSAPSGRLAVSGWEPGLSGGVIRVPEVPIRLRVGWHGLAEASEADDESAEWFEIGVFPGPVAPVEVIRGWPRWVLPTTSTTSDGLPMIVGPRATVDRLSLEHVRLSFWEPYPRTADGTVTDLWRDPDDGSTWASGTGHGDRTHPAHAILRQVTSDEARRLEAEGFPIARRFAIDGDGRIWTSGFAPFERTACLNLVTRSHFDVLVGLADDPSEISVVDLPSGWGRIIRRPRDGGPPVEVGEVDDADRSFFQRWPDGLPPPTR